MTLDYKKYAMTYHFLIKIIYAIIDNQMEIAHVNTGSVKRRLRIA